MMAKKISALSTRDQFEEKLAHIVEIGAERTAEEWMQDIEQEYGRVPLVFKRMGERPEVLISTCCTRARLPRQARSTRSTWS